MFSLLVLISLFPPIYGKIFVGFTQKSSIIIHKPPFQMLKMSMQMKSFIIIVMIKQSEY